MNLQSGRNPGGTRFPLRVDLQRRFKAERDARLNDQERPNVIRNYIRSQNRCSASYVRNVGKRTLVTLSGAPPRRRSVIPRI